MNTRSLLAAVLFFIPGTSLLRAQEATAVEASFSEMLRVVEDKEGAANVRAAAAMDAKVTGKVISGAVVGATITTNQGEWIELIDAGGDYDGGTQFMHRSRLKKLDGWKQMKAAPGGPEDKGTVTYAGAEAVVTAAAFVEKDHKITKKDEETLVDGRHVWGRDGGLPAKSLTLAVKVDGKAVAIPAEATRDLFEPYMESLVILTPGKPASQMVVAMWNSDGAGGYLVAWSFVNGKYAGRTVMSP